VDANSDALISALTFLIKLMLQQDTSVTKAQESATSTTSQQENVRILMEILGIPLKGMVITATSSAMKLGKNSAIRTIMVEKHVPIRKEPIMEPAHRQLSVRVMRCRVPVVT
jgi:hypothetical protein